MYLQQDGGRMEMIKKAEKKSSEKYKSLLPQGTTRTLRETMEIYNEDLIVDIAEIFVYETNRLGCKYWRYFCDYRSLIRRFFYVKKVVGQYNGTSNSKTCLSVAKGT